MRDKTELVVGIGKIGMSYGDTVLVSIGLGSCVGVALFDQVNKVFGMAHIMLPNSADSHLESPNMTILLSEHDTSTFNQLKDIYSKNEFSIAEEAHESFEAIRKYDSLTMGMVILSRYLPRLQGVETMKRIREKDRESRVILISPQSDRQSVKMLLDEGADEVLMDPFDERKVVEVTKSVIFHNQTRFADVALPILIYKMVNRGARIDLIRAKIAGGANIFSTMHPTDIGKIGDRNVLSVKAQLEKHRIRILAEDVGMNFGRTVRFDPDTLMLCIRTKNKEYSI